MRTVNISGRKGFTLIELMVVIAIIGILVAMLLPVVSKVRGLAFQRRCSANQREMVSALSIYRQKTKRVPPARGRMLWAYIVTWKNTGLSPDQMVDPAQDGEDFNTGGNELVGGADFEDPATPPQDPVTAEPGDHFLVSYAGRKQNTSIPTDAVNPASTPLSCDRKAFHGESVVISFLDGHVDTVEDPGIENDATLIFDDDNQRNPSYRMSVLTNSWDGS